MFVTSDQGKTRTQINSGLTERLTKGTLPAFRNGLGVYESQPETAYVSFTSPEKSNAR